MMVPFGDFAPDVAEQDSGVLEVAKNVRPIANGYAPFPGPSAYSGALAANPKGLFLFRNASGAYEQWAATSAKIYQLVTTTWTDRSGTLSFSLPAGDFWSVTQFGSKAIFTNYADGPHVVDVDSGTNVAALSGSPPTGRCIDVVNGHVMLGSTDSSDYGLAWSDTNDETNWSTGNSDSQTLPEGGRPRVICGAAGYVVQERGVTQITFQPGDSKVFSFDLVQEAKGTIAPNSVIKFGNDFAYLAEDGFWYRGEQISAERVGRTFFNRAAESEISQVQGVAHPFYPLFIWIYLSSSGATTYTSGLMYNWQLKKWSEIEVDLMFLGVIATPGLSPDSWTTGPDAETTSPDSRLFAGGAPTLAAFDTDKKLAFFDGSNLEATFETAELDVGNILSDAQERPGNRRAMIQTVRPIINTPSAVMNLGWRERLGDTRQWLASESSIQTSGNCYFHKDGRLFRFRVRAPSGTTWSYAKGIDVIARRAGRK